MALPDISQLAPLLSSARSAAVLLPTNPKYDTVAAACALKLVLESSGKNISIAAPDPITVEFTHLVGVNEIVTSFGDRNLIITFPDQTDFVDKVSYNVDQGQLQLVISPKPNSPDLDHKRLKFVSGNGQFDLVFLMGVGELQELGSFHPKAQEAISRSKAVSFTVHPPRESYGHLHIHDSESSSVSELLTHVFESMGLNLSQDASSNLLAGIENATDNFRSGAISAKTFHAASILMQKGGRRHQVFQPDNLPPGSVPQSPQPIQSSVPVNNQPIAQNQPTPQAQANTPPVPNNSFQPAAAPNTASAAPDWYEPKVYQGSMLQ